MMTSPIWPPRMRRMRRQRAATTTARFVTHDFNYTSSVTAVMRVPEWDSLQQQHQAKADMMYRIVNSLVYITTLFPGQA